jgi:hypothetical protein
MFFLLYIGNNVFDKRLNFTKPNFSLAAARMPPLFDDVRFYVAYRSRFTTFFVRERGIA